MNSKHDLEKKRKTLNMLGAILGIGSLILPVYLGIVFYDRGKDFASAGAIAGVVLGCAGGAVLISFAATPAATPVGCQTAEQL